jgi:hypothetical protein
MDICCNCGQHSHKQVVTPPHVVLSYPAERDGHRQWVKVYEASYSVRCGCGETVITKRGPLAMLQSDAPEPSELRLAYDPH